MRNPESDWKHRDPHEIKEDELPVFVLADDRRSFIAWAIKQRSNGFYNHAMVMIHPGQFATQQFTLYREVPVDAYMKPGIILKFWRYTKIVPFEAAAIRHRVENDLAKPWWTRRYDLLGVIGQATGLRWLNAPWLNYCSESVARNLRLIQPIKDQIPKRPSPADLNALFHKIEGMQCAGYWWDD